MIHSIDQEFIIHCRNQIESKINWGSGEYWSHYDFEKLSDMILTDTRVNLSPTTLKRFWGKLKSSHVPSQTTLNTLAAFLGFEDWRAFKHANSHVVKPGSLAFHKKLVVSRSIIYLIGSSLCALLVVYFVVAFRNTEEKHYYNPADFTFSVNKIISEGVPNSVVFTYDATKAETDSIYIVQTWDIRRKVLVAKNGHEHSAIYYYPGFFRTKLVIGDQVIKTHDLQITSGGWLALVEKEREPFYFKKEEYVLGDSIGVDESVLNRYNFSLTPQAPKIRFFHQGDLGDLMNDNFVFETTLKNDFSSGNNPCQYVEVLIQCKDDIIIIPLCAKICVGNASLYAAGRAMSSKEVDLSGFGADLHQWTTLRVVTVDRLIAFYVNGQKAESFIFPNVPTEIVGVQYRFYGPGAIRDAWFENKEGRIIELK